MVARGASPRTPAIAHTYLYTVIFKMKERRAGSRVVVERALTDWRSRSFARARAHTFARSLRRGKKNRIQTTAINHIFAGRTLTMLRCRRLNDNATAHRNAQRHADNKVARAESFTASAEKIRAGIDGRESDNSM